MGINTIKYLGRKFFGVRNLNTTPVYDADAQAYFNANTSITSAADKNAINTFYLGLKSDGIYTKLVAMYLPIWASAAASKWNLVNPADTNAAFRLTFSVGGVTYTSGGIQGNGTTGYADTNLTPSVHMPTSLNNMHISVYSRTNVDQVSIDIGSYFLSGIAQNLVLYLKTSNLFYGAVNVDNNNIASTNISNTNSQGFYIGNRTASNVLNAFKNGTKTLNKTTPSGVIQNVKTFLLAANNAGASALNYSTRQNCFFSIGYGLTDTEAANFSNRVNTLMTYFGINTY